MSEPTKEGSPPTADLEEEQTTPETVSAPTEEAPAAEETPVEPAPEPPVAPPPAKKPRTKAQLEVFEKTREKSLAARRARARERKEKIDRLLAQAEAPPPAPKAEPTKKRAVPSTVVQSVEEAGPLLDLLHPFLELTRVQREEIEELRKKRQRGRKRKNVEFSSDSETETGYNQKAQRAPDTAPIEKPRPQPVYAEPEPQQSPHQAKLANFMTSLGF